MRGFISYSRHDDKLYRRMREHLRPLERAFDIQFTPDQQDFTDRNFDAVVRSAIADASLHVVLISANLMWSDYIMEVELPLIRQKQRERGDLVLYVVLEDCVWELLSGAFLISPRDDNLDVRPVRNWRSIDLGLAQATEQISESIAHHFGLAPRPIS